MVEIIFEPVLRKAKIIPHAFQDVWLCRNTFVFNNWQWELTSIDLVFLITNISSGILEACDSFFPMVETCLVDLEQTKLWSFSTVSTVNPCRLCLVLVW